MYIHTAIIFFEIQVKCKIFVIGKKF